MINISKELVTCGFTTFNSSESIELAINSAFNQNYKNLEIVVIDDASTDNTLKVLENLAIKSPYPFRIFSNKKNMGVGFSRNILIDNSKGEFIVFFDDDDISYKNRISSQVKTIVNYETKNKINFSEKSPLCFCDRYLIKKNRKIVVKSVSIDFRKISNEDIKFAFLSCGFFPLQARPGSTATCALCARIKTLKSLGCFNSDLRRFEDLDLAIRSSINNVSMLSTNSILLDQFVSYGIDKLDNFNYEILLIEINKNNLNQKQYIFAKDFIFFKNACFSMDIFSILKYFLKLLKNNPYFFIRRILSSLRTIKISILYHYLKNK